jgi:hypothetical protein
LLHHAQPQVFADKRYQRADKRDKLPRWITAHLAPAHLSLTTDMLLTVARTFMRQMAQPYDPGSVGKSLLSQDILEAMAAQQQQQQQGMGLAGRQPVLALPAPPTAAAAAAAGGGGPPGGHAAPMELG